MEPLGVITSHCQGHPMFTELFSSSPHSLSLSRSLFDITAIADVVCERT